MNYAFMSFSCPDSSLEEMLALARRFGYAGLEPRAGSGHAHGVELETSATERAAIRDRAAAEGIALCCLAVSCRYADPDDVAAQVEETHHYIDLAADTGAPRLRVFGGRLPDNVARAQAIDGVAEALRSLADHAGERGVSLCLETHDDWCDPDHVAAVMERVDHPTVAINWDVLHPVRTAGRSLADSFTVLRPWIRHTHIHDASLQRGKIEYLPIGMGAIDHREVLALLQGSGYDGYLSGEWINWEPCEIHLPREIGQLRQYEEDLPAR